MEIVLPAAAQDPRERFARELVERSHRLQEVCSVLKIDHPQALELLKDPAVQAHITRLTTVGRAAIPHVDSLELAEKALEIVRMTPEEYVAIGLRHPGSVHMSLDGFFAVQLRAADWLKKAYFPSPDALLKRARKAAKNKGIPFDQAKAVREITATLTNTELPPEEQKP